MNAVPVRMTFGDAAYASRDELAAHDLLTDAPDALTLGVALDSGKANRRMPVGYAGERHMLVFGPNGSGKSTRFAATALLKSGAGRSWIVIDPKGELAAITAPWRRRIGPVHIVNPFGTLADRPGYGDLTSGRFNPLAHLDIAAASFNADAALLAEALVTMEGTQPFFPRSARNLIAALVMWETARAAREQRVPLLSRVRDMVTDPVNLPNVLEDIVFFRHRGMTNKAGPLLQQSRSIRDVISEAAAQTEFLDDSEIAADLTGPRFDFSAMKERPTTVYLILPAEMMERHTKWFRLVLSAALRGLMTERRKLPVTVLLDEYFLIANGGLQIIENCMAYVRGYGIQLIPMLQDLNQLQDLYPKRWQTFLSNAGVVLHMSAPADLTTSEWMSRRAGETTDFSQSVNDSSGLGLAPDQAGDLRASFNRGGGVSYTQTRVPFLPAHKLFDTPHGRVHGWKEGLANTILTDAPRYDDPALRLGDRARTNPYHVRR
jgi:type IV secretion system protein VirD4